jgi:hypothetical protein
MKRILIIGLTSLVVVYGIGLVRLGEWGAIDFVMEMEAQMSEGNVDAVCDMFHEDLEVDITDNTAIGSKGTSITGGKEEFCEQTRETVAGLKLLQHNSHVQFDDVHVKRSWLHPWTSEVSYTEDRQLTIAAIGQTFHTISDDTIILVHTFSGVKLRKVTSEAFVAE